MESMVGTALAGVKDFFSKEKFYSKEDMARLYERDLPSFSSRLPYGGFDEETGTFILEDFCSRAVCLTLKPIPTEGRSSEYLVRLRDAIEDMYDVFDPKSDSEGQWVIQEFSYDDSSVDALIERIEAAIAPHARGTKFTDSYLKMMRHHLMGLAESPDGLFHDKEVTGEPWGLKVPRTKMVLYRRVSASENKLAAQGKFDPAREVNQVVEDIKVKLGQAGVQVVRDEFQDVFEWLYKLFNPSPDILDFKTKGEYYQKVTRVEPELIGGSMSEALLGDFPESSIEDNCWYFNGKPMRFLRFAGLKKSPRIGQLAGEVVSGEGNSAITRCLTDSLPSGSIVAKTVVITTQSEFDIRLGKVAKAAKSTTPSAETARNNIQAVRAYGGNSKKILCSMGVYISAEDLDDLEDKQRKVLTVMNNNNITLFKDDVDGLSLDSFLIHLPMNFRPELDPKRFYLRSMYAQHAANLSLAFGRSEGSGNPCLIAFNRGGAPLMFDPFNSDEKANNSFGFIVGGPGSGKSVKICTDVYSIMAIKRPRLFIVEYGNSFGLAAQDWRAKGLVVNEMVLSNKNCPSLAPFATIDKVLEVPESKIDLGEESDGRSDIDSSNDDDNDDIDYLGELEQIAMLMVTGSESRELERYNRGDRSLLRRALVQTAQRNRDLGIAENGKPKPTITQDVIDTLRQMATGGDKNISDVQAGKLLEMAQSLEGYTTGFNGKLFNRPGEQWPDADITLVNLATLSSENNRDKLNVAYTSLAQYINNLAEQTQNEPRDIVLYTDEAHLLLSNDQLSKLIVTQVKTARKLGVWPQLCTQNVQDCSGEAEKLLSMIEWYYCLNTGITEARHVKRHKDLSDDQVKLITSTRKQARAYTEGVVLSDKAEYQFRSVPPSLILAVSMTESSEKAQRASVLTERGLRNELEAAYEVAADLDKARGIKGVLSYDEVMGV
ncbi:conjugative transfer ATPase [Vibrio parahaemolyticus]|nr:conjugative transfer ATPase [Vibrio parahaemolyticus]